MSLFSEALKTYETAEKAGYVGVLRDGYILAPVAHNTTNGTIEITVSSAGDFITANTMEKNSVVVIPVTEDSAKRSGKITKDNMHPHPLCDKVEFIFPTEEDKHQCYMNQLITWAESEFSHPAVRAVASYLKKGTIISDLKNCAVIDDEQSEGFICWSVIGIGQESGPVWNGKNKSIIDAWTNYYLARKKDDKLALCMVSGEVMPVADDHLKGVYPLEANAKMISFKDDKNAWLRYRGRFHSRDDVLTIGYETDQKMHNAIKWIVKAFGVKGLGSRVMACWIPTGLISPVENITFPLLFRDEQPLSPVGYKEELNKKLLGIKERIPENDGVCLLALDAATPGRVSIPFFTRLTGSQLVINLEEWDLWCCWNNGRYGVESPKLFDIVDFAYGNPKGGKNGVEVKADDRIRPKILQELIQIRSCGGVFPVFLFRNLVRNSSKLINYIGEKGDERVKNKLLFISCSAIRKYRHDRFKEDLKIMLEIEKEDRSYQFGRLLAVMEKIEKDAVKQSEKGSPTETNALRYQSLFVQNPMRGEKNIMDKLKRGYWAKLKPGTQVLYDRIIGQIHEMLSHFKDEENRKPLSEMYLLGYYLQMNALYERQSDYNNVITEEQEK